jgi:glycosyltransferase involved in cell wall biosynthesis
MRIAQIAPLAESVPPQLYGGSERIASYLTEELVRMGHDVTLFASADSLTAARLVGCARSALRLDETVLDALPHQLVMLEQVRRRAHEFDILHFHIDQFHFPIFHEMARRTVTTLHGRQDLPDLHHLYRGFPAMPLVSISDAQRAPIPDANYAGTVYHGLPKDLTVTLDPRGGYLAFIGRISPEKRVDRAIAIARAVGMPLKIAAKIDRVDEAYFRAEIEPLLEHPGIHYIGEIDDRRKASFLGEASALLFPIDWPEPFGLAMIEAMACGTPVLAFRHGAVPEVVDDGVTGYAVDSMDEAICALGGVLALDRGRVRRRFEERFSVRRMAQDYVRIYQRLVGAEDTRREDVDAPALAVRTNGRGHVAH